MNTSASFAGAIGGGRKMKGKTKAKKAMPKGIAAMRAKAEHESPAKEKREMMGKDKKGKGY